MIINGIELKWGMTIEIDKYDNFIVRDKQGNKIYLETSEGYWMKNKYDDKGNEIHFENSNCIWTKSEFDKNNNMVYYEDSSGFWKKMKYDENSNMIYYKNSEGVIIDNRPKIELTL